MRWRVIIALLATISLCAESIAQTYRPMFEAREWPFGHCADEDLQGLEYHFDICLGRKKIGEYQTNRLVSGDLVLYCAKSRVRLWIFNRIDIRYSLECAFANDSLLYSTCVGWRNDKEHIRSEVIRNNGAWYVTHNGQTRIEKGPLTSSIVHLYYHVPEIGERTLVESSTVIKEVVDKNAETYYLKERGKRGLSEMIYQDGIIQRVNVDFPLLRFSVVKQAPGLPECVCQVDIVQ